MYVYYMAGVDVIVKEAMANGRLLKGAHAARVNAAASRSAYY